VALFLGWGQYLGIPIGTLLASAGIGGVAIALGAQDTLKTLFGTMMLMADKPFRVGERIRFSYWYLPPDHWRAKASQAYFQSVSTLLDDLRKEFDTNRDARRTLAPTYMDRYGRRIDRLPILNVDPELLAYGASVSASLRGTAVTTRKAGVSVRAAQFLKTGKRTE